MFCLQQTLTNVLLTQTTKPISRAPWFVVAHLIIIVVGLAGSHKVMIAIKVFVPPLILGLITLVIPLPPVYRYFDARQLLVEIYAIMLSLLACGCQVCNTRGGIRYLEVLVLQRFVISR